VFATIHATLTHSKQVKESRLLTSLGITDANGVYTTRPREENELIAFYDCERVTDAQLDLVYGVGGTRVYTLDDSSVDGTYADAHRQRCIAALINDARGARRAGVKDNVYFCNLSQPYAIRALRRIEAGEELLLNYGREVSLRTRVVVAHAISHPVAFSTGAATRPRPTRIRRRRLHSPASPYFRFRSSVLAARSSFASSFSACSSSHGRSASCAQTARCLSQSSASRWSWRVRAPFFAASFCRVHCAYCGFAGAVTGQCGRSVLLK